MFEHIDEAVNLALTTQAPAAAPVDPLPAAPTAPAPEPTALEVANARIAALEAEQAATQVQHESALAESRLKTVAAEAHKPMAKLNLGLQDAQLAQAIRAAGGLALWTRLPEQKQAAALGIPDSSGIKTSLVKQFFGPTSSSAAAAQLATNDPAQYQRLRLAAKLRRIL